MASMQSDGSKGAPCRKTPADERWELAQRIAASQHFQRSARLRNFLLYIVGRVIESSSAEIREQEIATRIFGRPADQEAGDDTIVRVHASQLRKRLAQYFAAEGALESLVIEIPRGNYAPVFQHRTPLPAPKAARWNTRLPLLITGSLAVVFGGLSLLLVIENRQLSKAVAPVGMAKPVLSQFWSQVLAPGGQVDVVLADSNLGQLEDVLKMSIGLNAYLSQAYDSHIQTIRSPELRASARDLMRRQHTSFADAMFVDKLSRLHKDGVWPTVFFARDFHARHLRNDNVILLGSKRSNPWSELFEHRLNFQFGFNDEQHSAYVVNRTPRPGEQLIYRAQRGSGLGQASYCLIAYLPNLGQTGSILLIAGTEMEGTEAGGEVMTNEYWLSRVRRTFGSTPRNQFPFFEVLLKTTKVGGAAPEFEILSVRPISARP